jgi:hypothetical protein
MDLGQGWLLKKLAVAHMEATWEKCGPQKKLAIACKWTTRHVKVAQQKENFIG